MAIATSKLYAVEDAFVTKASPMASYHNLVSVTMPYDYSDSGNTRYFIRFEQFTAAQKRKHIVALQLFLYIASVTYGTGWQHTGGGGGWDNTPATEPRKRFSAERYTDHEIDGLTYDTLHAVLGSRSSYKDMYPATLQPGAENYMGSAFEDTRWAEGVVALYPMYGNDASITFHGVLGASKPYLLLSMEDAEISVTQTPMAGAYVNRHKAVKLAWGITTNAYGGAAAFTQASAVVTWRDGASGTESTISITGENAECHVSADTFPATDALQWKVSVTFASSETSDSDWATVSTLDETSTCTAQKPINVYVDGSIENEFAWEHATATGTEQTAYDLQYSADGGITWIDIAQNVASAVEGCSVAANTLPSGALKWRVRTYNADGVAGEWCSPAEIIVIAAPKAPAIATATATPRPEITWSATEQQGYQVQAAEYDSGTVYGSAKKHKIPCYLSDGITEIRVRVQNEYGLWSDWASTDVTIANAQITQITLTARAENSEALLSWNGNHTRYYIYRDGVLIGKTDMMQFVDHYSIGTHKYDVRGAVGDNYDMSNVAEITLECEKAMIADVETCAWHVLRHKRGAEPVISVSPTHDVAYQHYAGRRLPVAEIAEYEDESYSFEYAFLDRAEAIAIRNALLGHVVILKTPHEECYIGVLESMSHSTDSIATDAAFTLRAVDWQEEITYDV